MTEFSLKYSEIVKKEENEEENKKKLLEISQSNYNLKRKIHENEIQTAATERELIAVKEDCGALEIDLQLQKNQIKKLKSKIQHQSKVLQAESSNVEQIQQEVWEKMEEFILETRNSKKQKELCEVKDFIQIRDILKRLRRIEKDKLKLEGEVYALNMYKEFQQKQIKLVEQTYLFLGEAEVLKGQQQPIL